MTGAAAPFGGRSAPGLDFPATTGPLLYHGGRVLHSSTVRTVFWDPSTPPTGVSHFGASYVSLINQFVSDLGTDSPNNGNVFVGSDGSPEPRKVLNERDARERWAAISIYDKPPMTRRLSGLAVEYVILELFSRDSGQRSAQLAFSVGQGTQDVGYRNDLPILFTALPARTVTFRVRDEHGHISCVMIGKARIAVRLARRIEMSSGAHAIGRAAIAFFVNMKSMVSRRQT